MYQHFQQNARLAALTGRVLGASDTPSTPDQARALGMSMLWMMSDEDALEAQCLAAELRDLSDEARDRFASTRLRLRMTTITPHVSDEIGCVAALLAGFFLVNLGDAMRPEDWRDYADLCVADAGVATVSIPPQYSWTGRQFVSNED
ncbi:hypothetical protein [Salipiger abyssi]|nr:hypothetical protein [Salipiger abyssi]